MKACTVYILSEEGPDKDRNINKKGPNEEKRLGTFWTPWIFTPIDQKSLSEAKFQNDKR